MANEGHATLATDAEMSHSMLWNGIMKNRSSVIEKLSRPYRVTVDYDREVSVFCGSFADEYENEPCVGLFNIDRMRKGKDPVSLITWSEHRFSIDWIVDTPSPLSEDLLSKITDSFDGMRPLRRSDLQTISTTPFIALQPGITLEMMPFYGQPEYFTPICLLENLSHTLVAGVIGKSSCKTGYALRDIVKGINMDFKFGLKSPEEMNDFSPAPVEVIAECRRRVVQHIDASMGSEAGYLFQELCGSRAILDDGAQFNHCINLVDSSNIGEFFEPQEPHSLGGFRKENRAKEVWSKIAETMKSVFREPEAEAKIAHP